MKRRSLPYTCGKWMSCEFNWWCWLRDFDFCAVRDLPTPEEGSSDDRA
jgi:hypothetical protein